MKKILFVLAMLMLVACAGNRGVSETQISTAPAYLSALARNMIFFI
ncbi:MAG: hypothetical protein MJZ05_12930 [Fibrobacter sp.]|nr:hypothetical protein [Fibrobacter sp.]